MDVISLGKASRALRDIKNLDDNVVAPLAESRFPTVDARLDWLEGQAGKLVAENSMQIDLSKGVFTDTEFVDGKVQLSVVGETSVEKNVALNKQASASGNWSSNTPPSAAIDGLTTISWAAPSGTSAWWKVDLQNLYKVKKIRIANNNSTDGAYGTKYNVSGSIDDISYTMLGSLSDLTDMKGEFAEIIPSVISDFRYIKVTDMATSTSIGGKITELQVIGEEKIKAYILDGVYETSIIDLGKAENSINLINIVNQINVGSTNCSFEISTSNDGISFTDYESFDIANPPQVRYIKIKASFASVSGEVKANTYEFNQSENNKVTLNEFVLANGDLKLKKDYYYPTEDLSILDAGKIIKTTIPKTLFESIQRLEVK